MSTSFERNVIFMLFLIAVALFAIALATLKIASTVVTMQRDNGVLQPVIATTPFEHQK